MPLGTASFDAWAVIQLPLQIECRAGFNEYEENMQTDKQGGYMRVPVLHPKTKPNAENKN
jgi:hypothetical protein